MPLRTVTKKIHSAPTHDAADTRLVGRFLEMRDEELFRELYRRHAPALYRFALLRAGAEAADDVVQETWLRAMRGLAGYRGAAAFRTWLTGIALNVCREGKGRRMRLVPAEPSLAAVPDPEPPTSAGERKDLQWAIGKLPEAAREVLLLHDVEGHTHSEIGELLGIAPGTSKSQLHKARRALRASLADEGRSHG